MGEAIAAGQLDDKAVHNGFLDSAMADASLGLRIFTGVETVNEQVWGPAPEEGKFVNNLPLDKFSGYPCRLSERF